MELGGSGDGVEGIEWLEMLISKQAPIYIPPNQPLILGLLLEVSILSCEVHMSPSSPGLNLQAVLSEMLLSDGGNQASSYWHHYQASRALRT